MMQYNTSYLYVVLIFLIFNQAFYQELYFVKHSWIINLLLK